MAEDEHRTVLQHHAGVQRTREVPSRKLYHETIVVAVVNTAQQFRRTSELQSVIVQASVANNGTIMVGTSSSVSSVAGANEGFNLSKGEHLTMTINNASQLYVAGTHVADRAILLGMG